MEPKYGGEQRVRTALANSVSALAYCYLIILQENPSILFCGTTEQGPFSV